MGYIHIQSVPALTGRRILFVEMSVTAALVAESSICETYTNGAGPDGAPHDAAPDLGMHCLM